MTEAVNKNESVVSPNTRVTAIISQKIPEDKKEEYLIWQKGITDATAVYEGYDRTELFPPVPGVQDDWVTVVHFKTNASLDKWLQSDTRVDWNKKFEQEFGNFEIRKMASGLGFWFDGKAKTAPWKMVLTVTLALYPSVVMVTMFVMPQLTFLPLAARLLIGNLITVSALQWLFMPHLTKALEWWYQPSPANKQRIDILGLGMVLLLLGGMVFVFTQLVG